jgi:Mg-chelatase subunit ChlD
VNGEVISQGSMPAGESDSSTDAAADELVARAIESVLEAVPAGGEEPLPEALARYQPWADTATPSAKNKRPLQALLDELTARVEAEPDARAAAPTGKPPMLTFFDRFGSPRREGEGRSSRARRRRNRGRGAAAGVPGSPAVQARNQPAAPAASGPQPPQGPMPAGERTPDKGSRRRRRRRGRGGRGGENATSG